MILKMASCFVMGLSCIWLLNKSCLKICGEQGNEQPLPWRVEVCPSWSLVWFVEILLAECFPGEWLADCTSIASIVQGRTSGRDRTARAQPKRRWVSAGPHLGGWERRRVC